MLIRLREQIMWIIFAVSKTLAQVWGAVETRMESPRT